MTASWVVVALSDHFVCHRMRDRPEPLGGAVQYVYGRRLHLVNGCSDGDHNAICPQRDRLLILSTARLAP